MREKPIRIGRGRQATATRRFAKNKTLKNAIEAATWPEGNAWYLALNRFQTSSTLTDGRARPVAI